MGKLFGVIAGLVAMFVISLAVQVLVVSLHPAPAGLDPRDKAAMAAWIAAMPVSALLVTVIAWALGALGGAWLALRIARWTPAAWIVGGFTAAFALNQTLRTDYPLWMSLAAIAAPLLGAWLAIRLAFPAVPADESIADSVAD